MGCIRLADPDYAPGEEIKMATIAEWPALRTEWERLHASCEAPTFFLSPLWMDAWLSTFGADLNPIFACYVVEGNLQGIVLFNRQREAKGPFRIKELFLNTAGESAGSPVLEHNVLLCDAKKRNAFARLLGQHINNQGWDKFLLHGIRKPDYCAISDVCGPPIQDNWRASPYIDLQTIRDNRNSFLDSLSSNSRQKIRRSIRLYEAQGQIDIEYAPTVETAQSFLDELVQLHQASWNRRGKPGAFASDKFRSFHMHIIKAGSPKSDYQLVRIRAGSDTIGVIYNLVHDKHISYYQSGFCYQSDNRMKPGLACHALVIQDALEAGYREYDFLATAGDGSQYKSSLSNAERQLGWITYRRDNLKNRALQKMQTLRGKLRR